MKNRKNYMMSEKVEVWLKHAPMPDVATWLRSLYVDNVLLVSENSEARWAEYGKKLMVDLILGIQRDLKTPAPKNTPVTDGSELLGVLYPENDTRS